jgi:asparagine synthase (glutamine-hydrolysing)
MVVCGIAGEIDFKDGGSQVRVSDLVSKLAHRGSDDHGLWTSPDELCVLGHGRLSIIDLTPGGHQPMIDPLTGNAIVFNGEIYNFRECRKKCEAKGDHFGSQSDTEVILALYRRYGEDCLRYLRGMFAFAIWNAEDQSLFLSRDRVGKKPLNYALTANGIVFASEIHPLSRHATVSTDMDLDALELYLQLEYIPAPWTIYRQIRKLPPAHFAVFDRNGFRLKKYWEVDFRDKHAISEQDALDGLEEKLTEATRLRMLADVPVGALLSGGVDSSLIVALMSSLGKPVRTFSIGFEEEAYNELPFARQAADICKTIHHSEIVTSNIEDLLPKLVQHYGEPFSDSSSIPSFVIAKKARQHVKVVLNGDGGDELLGGYSRYCLSGMRIRAGTLLGRWTSPDILSAFFPKLALSMNLPTRALRKFLKGYIHPELESLLRYGGLWNDPERAILLGKSHNSTILHRWRREWLEGALDCADNPIDKMLWLDSHTYLPGDLMAKMDIASMHCGLETRSPYLDHEVIEYCARLPVELKVKGRVGKHLLKKVAERYYPPEFVHRRKMGFGIPLAQWLRGPLRPMLENVLNDAATLEPLNKVVAGRLLTEFFEMRKDHSSRICALLMFGLWKMAQK